MTEKEMTLNEFINLSESVDNGDGSFGVTITLSNGQDSTLTVSNCKKHYEAKERAFLYLLELISKNKE